jgi:hypothetical protein
MPKLACEAGQNAGEREQEIALWLVKNHLHLSANFAILALVKRTQYAYSPVQMKKSNPVGITASR